MVNVIFIDNFMMKFYHFLAISLCMLLSLSACSHEDPDPMVWEIGDYNSDALRVVCSSDGESKAHIYIYADTDYSGTVLLKCVNYKLISVGGMNVQMPMFFFAQGFSTELHDENTLAVNISAIEDFDPENVQMSISVGGINGKEDNSSQLTVVRILHQAN